VECFCFETGVGGGVFADGFRFHIVTAYDILRMKGVDVGKMDFLNGAGGIVVEDIPQ
jgi:hypothetical protein